MKHYVIYIPGLGDTKTTAQELAVRLWRIHGVNAEVVPMRWAIGRNYHAKFNKLLARIDELIDQGYEVSLVGASAGASVAMNALAVRPNLHAVIGICGVMNTNVPVNPQYFRHNPSFKMSMEDLPKSLDKLNPEERHRVMSIRALSDKVVKRRSTIIRGALHKKVWMVGHALTIAFMITLGSRTIVKFIKKKARRFA